MPPKKATAAKGAATKSSTAAAVKKAPAKKTTTKPTSTSAAKAKKATTPASKTAKAPMTTKTTTPKTATKKSPAESSEAAASSSRPKAAAKGATAAAKKTAATISKKEAPAMTPEASVSKKRKSPDADDNEGEAQESQKKAKVTKTAAKPKPVKAPTVPKPKAVKAPKARKVINEGPAERLNVFVCGEGGAGELGLGAAKNAIDVKRPRLNKNLSAEDIGVVQMAVGGMHAAALTHDARVYTWGVNDQGALGRDTNWEGGLKDIDDAEKGGNDSDSDSEDESGLNPRESTPTAVPDHLFPPGTRIVALAAGDSTTFALTDVGEVWGWGTFRSNEGILGFSQEVGIAKEPTRVEGLKNIKQIACGDNHCLALNDKGQVYSWGSGQQNQLGRRIIERTATNGLVPRQFGLPKNIVQVACGAYHSFAISRSGEVYGWGSNNFGETGIVTSAGEDNAVIFKPESIKALKNRNVIHIAGGAHHSLAITQEGECLVWGRVDGYQTGIKVDTLPADDLIKDEKGRARILTVPTRVPGINAAYGCCGTDHTLAISKEGKAYAWGFSTNYQTGLGTTDDVEVATMIDNTATRNEKMNWAGAGGQFSILTSIASASS